MEFYTLLKSCYKSGVSPFMLRSLMADLCKGNIKLSRQIECLYQLHKQSDIFAKISLCTQTDFEQLVKGYTTEQATCVYAVAKLLHSEWQIVQPSSNSTVRKIKVQKANPTTTPINIAPPQLTSPAPQTPKNKAVKQPVKKVAKGKGGGRPFAKAKNVYITSLLSNLQITTCKGGVDLEIRVVENGKYKTLKSGIIKRSDRVYINVENVVADQKRSDRIVKMREDIECFFCTSVSVICLRLDADLVRNRECTFRDRTICAEKDEDDENKE